MTNLCTLALLAMSALAGPAGTGGDVSDVAGLLDENVVSTASKSAETAGLAPATTSVITADDLRRHGITSLHEAVDFLGMGMLTEPNTHGTDIGARGVLFASDYGNHMLLLLDGHALNEPWDGTAYFDRTAAIPMDLVDHIELILGPGSVLYGSNAMLGVINVITKRAKDYQGVHVLAEGGAPQQAHGAVGYGERFRWFGHEAEVTAGLDYYQSWGPRLTFGPQDYGGGVWGGGDATHGSNVDPAGHLRLVVGDLDVWVRGAYSKRSAELFGSFDNPDNWERERWLSVDARWSRALTPGLQATIRLYGDLYDYRENYPSISAFDCLTAASCLFTNSGISRWGGVEATATYDWAQDGRFMTLVGVDLRERHVTSWSTYVEGGATTVVSPYNPWGTALGAYLQQTLQPASWISINAGVRLDRDEQQSGHLSPRAAVVFPTWKDGTLKAIYSEAFRAPTYYERYYSDGLTWLAAPALKPETVRSAEVALEQRLGAQRLTLTAFHTWWSDLVTTVEIGADEVAAAIARGELGPSATPGSVFGYGNASRVNAFGLNAGFEGSALVRRLRYGGSLTWGHSRFEGADGSSTPLAAAAQVFGNARVSYELGGKLPTVALAARFAGPRPVAETNFSPVPDASTQVEVRAAVSGPVGGGLSYRLAGSWALSDTTAYAVGPLRDPQPGFASQAVLPQPRFQAWAGLRYDR